MTYVRKIKHKLQVISVGAIASVGSSVALAVNDADVTAAYTAGTTSVNNGLTLYIAMVATVIGVGLIVSMFKKG